MPRRAKVSTIEVFRYKFAEVPMPRRAKELAYWFEFRKRNFYSATVTTRGPSIAAVRPATLGLTTVSCAITAVGEVFGQCKHKVLASDPTPHQSALTVGQHNLCVLPSA